MALRGREAHRKGRMSPAAILGVCAAHRVRRSVISVCVGIRVPVHFLHVYTYMASPTWIYSFISLRVFATHRRRICPFDTKHGVPPVVSVKSGEIGLCFFKRNREVADGQHKQEKRIYCRIVIFWSCAGT